MRDHHDQGNPVNETDDLVLWRRWLAKAIPWLVLAGVGAAIIKYLF